MKIVQSAVAGKYRFVTTCVDQDMNGSHGEAIHDMRDNRSSEILGYDDILQLIGRDELKSAGLDPDTLDTDFAVSWEKSVWRGIPCIYIVQSGIEHIFTLNGQTPDGPYQDEETAGRRTRKLKPLPQQQQVVWRNAVISLDDIFSLQLDGGHDQAHVNKLVTKFQQDPAYEFEPVMVVKVTAEIEQALWEHFPDDMALVDSKDYLLLDGNHRVEAAHRVGEDFIRAEVDVDPKPADIVSFLRGDEDLM